MVYFELYSTKGGYRLINTKNKNGTLKKQLIELGKKHYLHPSSSIKQVRNEGPGIIFTEGNGVYLQDIDGKQYMDSLSSLWNVNIGHGRKEISEVAKGQMDTLAFSSSFNTWGHEPAIKLAAEIATWTPSNLNATFFTSGGSESNDTAFKTVRHYWKINGKPEKKKIISRELSYHGVAMGSTSATGLKQFRDFTTSLAPDFLYVDDSLDSLRTLIETEGADTIAAFITEPIQCSGGVNIPKQGYFEEVRKICDDHDILFISDEVICGFGRTGKNFGIENFGVVPDIITMAKGVTSGYAPLGGMIISDQIHDDLAENYDGNFWHGYTYSGHPTASSIALKNLEIIKNEHLIDNVRIRGKQLMNGLLSLQKSYNVISDVRGIGLLSAIEFKRTENEITIGQKVLSETLKRGIICRLIQYGGQDSLAIAPPFIINKKQVDDLLTILGDSIKAAIE